MRMIISDRVSHLMWQVDSLEKILMLGNIEGRWKRGQQWKRWLDGITDSLDMNLGKLQQMVKDSEVWHAAVHGATKSRMWLSNWTTTTRKEDPFKMKYFLGTWKLWPRKSYGLLRASVPGREKGTAQQVSEIEEAIDLCGERGEWWRQILRYRKTLGGGSWRMMQNNSGQRT